MPRHIMKSSLSWLNNSKEENTTKIPIMQKQEQVQVKGKGIRDNFTQVMSTNPQAKEKMKSFINFKI